jgi:hypothetical protein
MGTWVGSAMRVRVSERRGEPGCRRWEGEGSRKKNGSSDFSLDKGIIDTYNRKIVKMRSLMWLSFGSLRTE